MISRVFGFKQGSASGEGQEQPPPAPAEETADADMAEFVIVEPPIPAAVGQEGEGAQREPLAWPAGEDPMAIDQIASRLSATVIENAANNPDGLLAWMEWDRQWNGQQWAAWQAGDGSGPVSKWTAREWELWDRKWDEAQWAAWHKKKWDALVARRSQGSSSSSGDASVPREE